MSKPRHAHRHSLRHSDHLHTLHAKTTLPLSSRLHPALHSVVQKILCSKTFFLDTQITRIYTFVSCEEDLTVSSQSR